MKENNKIQKALDAASRPVSEGWLQRFFQVRELPILLYIIIMMVVFSISINGFLAVKNFENISRQITTIGIVSVGMTLVILTGGIDLSVGAMLSFAINIGHPNSGTRADHHIGNYEYLPGDTDGDYQGSLHHPYPICL